MIWNLIAFTINRPVTLISISYLFSTITVAFCPPIQIYGPNVLRLFLAEKVLYWLGDVSSFHVAGAITDFKKLMLFISSAVLLLAVRAALSTDKYNTVRDMNKVDVREAFSIKKDFLGFMAGLLLVIVLGLFTYNNVLPGGAGHVFGFKGVGLFSAFSRDYQTLETVAIVVYRLSYLPLMLLMFITSAISLPSYLRSIVIGLGDKSSPPSPEDEITFATVSLQMFFVPVLGLFFVMLLYFATTIFGIGELHGAAKEVALATATVLVVWTIMGVNWIARKRVVEKDPFRKLVLVLRQYRKAIKHISFYLFSTILFAVVALLKSLDVSAVEVMRANVTNRLIEYCDWEMDRAFLIIDSVKTDVQRIGLSRHEAKVMDTWTKLEISADPNWSEISILETYLTQVTLIKTMFLCSIRHDTVYQSRLMNYRDSGGKGENKSMSNTDWLFSMGGAEVKFASKPMSERAIELRRTRSWYDEYALNLYRRRTLYLLADDLQNDLFADKHIYLFQSLKSLTDLEGVNVEDSIRRISDKLCLSSIEKWFYQNSSTSVESPKLETN